MSSSHNERPDVDEYTTGESHKSKRFRFKTKTSSDQNSRVGDDRSNGHKRRHHHHRSKRRKTSTQPTNNPSAYDDSVSGLPPDTAFRESLFDAMGDDEGAAFWEGVYGQPIHNFPNTYQDERTGELEQMNEDEYAQFVRRKMWDKSWEGIEAAKEEKRREREREKQNIREETRFKDRQQIPKHETDYLFDLDIEKSLRRGERRRDQKRWKELWREYLQKWEELQVLRETWKSSDDNDQIYLRNKIAWPVESGKRKDISPAEIERFITHCGESVSSEQSLSSILKSERIRWHPDKMQQRYGFMGLDDGTLQGATAVFQVLDRMWNTERDEH